MRIVTRPDFDGVACAVLLHDVLNITEPTCWLTAAPIQRGEWHATTGDVIANLPYHANCTLWFDHHASNEIASDFDGVFEVAPSAARVIYEYYKDSFSEDFSELVEAADHIDSAQLTMDEVLDPALNPYFLLSITLEDNYCNGESYWNKIVNALSTSSIDKILALDYVDEHCQTVFNQHDAFREQLLNCTVMDGLVSVTDFRELSLVPDGNRFLVYCLFPDCITNVKVCHSSGSEDLIRCSVGHNIFNRECQVNAGELLKKYNGGGHFGAGGASLESVHANQDIKTIISALNKNISL